MILNHVPRRRRRLTLAISLALAVGSVRAATITVTDGGDTTSTSICTLRDAIVTMANGSSPGSGEGNCRTNATTTPYDFGTHDTIVFSTAVPSSSTITLGGAQLTTYDSTLTITGSGQTVDANGASRVLKDRSQALYLNSLTLRGGSASGYGGGVNDNGGDLSMAHVTISGNYSASKGGGVFVYVTSGMVSVTDSTISGNSAPNDAGMFGYMTGDVSIVDSTISGNHAVGHSPNASVAPAGYGSGLSCQACSTMLMVNSTVSGNYAYYGAAVSASDSSLSILDSTISANSAQQDSSGLVLYGYSATLGLYNTILAGNSVSSGLSDYHNYTHSYSLTISHSLLGTAYQTALNYNGNQFSDAPVLALNNNGGATETMAPKVGSLALNNGDPALAMDPSTGYALSFDQRGIGFPRTLSGQVDIGAFQHQPTDRIFAGGFDSGP